MNIYFGENRMRDLRTRTLICTCEIDEKNEAHPTRIFDSSRQNDSGYLVKDVASASASAPTYFQYTTIDDKKYIDGGLRNNNPSKIALETLLADGVDKEHIVMLSLGTGNVQNADGFAEYELHWAIKGIDYSINS